MLHLFSRAELITLFDRARCAELQEILGQNNIESHVKVFNRMTQTHVGGGRRTPPPLQTSEKAWQYTIYVARKDLDFARHVTGLGEG